MRVLEADLDRIRLTVRRPARAEAFALLAGIATLALAPVGWLWVVTTELSEVETALAEPAPTALPCTWDTLHDYADCADLASELRDLPTLSQVYLARRRFHRARLVPEVFEGSPPLVAPLDEPFAHIVHDDDQRRLMGHILRDATVALPDDAVEGRAAGWMGRDPILGVPMAGRSHDDAYVLEHARDYAPILPAMPDSGRPAAALVADGILRETAEGTYLVSSEELRAHLAYLAARDVLTYADLRAEVVIDEVARRHAAERESWETRRTTLQTQLATWDAGRRRGIPTLVGCWLVGALMLMPLSWCFRRRLTITMDLHALTLGETRLLWEALDELTWTHRRVSWQLEGGSKGKVGDLDLTDGEVRMLERTSTAVWLRDRGGPPTTALRAIRQLVDGARRDA
ncbi:MAG: hypothetical protein AAF211_00600 [Myxococcota bacterium]